MGAGGGLEGNLHVGHTGKALNRWVFQWVEVISDEGWKDPTVVG